MREQRCDRRKSQRQTPGWTASGCGFCGNQRWRAHSSFSSSSVSACCAERRVDWRRRRRSELAFQTNSVLSGTITPRVLCQLRRDLVESNKRAFFPPVCPSAVWLLLGNNSPYTMVNLVKFLLLLCRFIFRCRFFPKHMRIFIFFF